MSFSVTDILVSFFCVQILFPIISPIIVTHHPPRSLDTKDVMRTDYLMTLSLLLNRSSWVEHGRYRRGDIAACLESILDVGGDGVDG